MLGEFGAVDREAGAGDAARATDQGRLVGGVDRPVEDDQVIGGEGLAVGGYRAGEVGATGFLHRVDDEFDVVVGQFAVGHHLVPGDEEEHDRSLGVGAGAGEEADVGGLRLGG